MQAVGLVTCVFRLGSLLACKQLSRNRKEERTNKIPIQRRPQRPSHGHSTSSSTSSSSSSSARRRPPAPMTIAALGLLSSSAYFGTLVLESVLRHFGVCGIGSLSSSAYFGIGLVAFCRLRHLVLSSAAYFGIGSAVFGFCGIGSCRPSPILESVLRHFGVCGIGSFVIFRLFWNRSCGILPFAAFGIVIHRLFWNRFCGIWVLRHWVSCHPPPILESVLRHFGVCGIGSFVVHRLFWNRSCGILGPAGLGLLSSTAYFGIGPAAFWGLRHWVSCHPPPILESVLRHLGFAALGLLSSTAYFGIGPAAFWGLRHWVSCHPPPILESVLWHFGVCGIGSLVILRLFWNRSCGILGFAAFGLLSSTAYF